MGMTKTKKQKIARIVFYQKNKNKKNGEIWVPVIEDVSYINTPETLEARNKLEQIILGEENEEKGGKKKNIIIILKK